MNALLKPGLNIMDRCYSQTTPHRMVDQQQQINVVLCLIYEKKKEENVCIANCNCIEKQKELTCLRSNDRIPRVDCDRYALQVCFLSKQFPPMKRATNCGV